uniref:zinc finger TRAF-type-containing protein 1 isoform X2 n=1 Tax=Panthera onca TaxID=9690 RepID=UPI00295507DA|nr:zinc finger TRAF-type-containing protein 1 isoform X2 [Panthera onca]
MRKDSQQGAGCWQTVSGPQICGFTKGGGPAPTDLVQPYVLPVAPILPSRHALCPHILVPGQLGLLTCHSSVQFLGSPLPVASLTAWVATTLSPVLAKEGWSGGDRPPTASTGEQCLLPHLTAAGQVPQPCPDKSLCSCRRPEIRASRGLSRQSLAPGMGRGQASSPSVAKPITTSGPASVEICYLCKPPGATFESPTSPQELHRPCLCSVPGKRPVLPEQWLCLLNNSVPCLSSPAVPSAAGAGGACWCVRVCTSCKSVSSSPFPSSQCTNGHLMCAGCFIHLLADARLKEEQATCPNCRCEISKSLCCRNLAVEKAVSELPSECGFCLRQFPRSLLERHQKEECQDRVTQCKYKRIGCPWHGPFHELTVHEAACAHPTKTGNELMEILDEMDQSHRKEMQLYNSIFSLLSFEKIGYTALGQSGSKQKVGVSWRARELEACPVEPKARRALSTSGPACRQLLQWPRAS